MAELKKRYQIQAAQADGSIVNIFAKVQVFAVYTKKRSNNYMDTDDYCALVDEWEGELLRIVKRMITTGLYQSWMNILPLKTGLFFK